MGVFTRLSDIINSNINAMLDRAENPEKMIRMVIQEMEETLVEVRSTTARILAEKKELTRRNERLARQAEEWEARAGLALEKGREDLAKAALIEKATLQEHIAHADSDQVKLDESLDKLAVEIEQLQVKLSEARARQKTILMRQKTTENRRAVNHSLHNNAIDRAINRFDHFERRIDAMESEIEAMEMTRDIDAEFDALARQSDIDKELAAMKEKLKKASTAKQDSQ